MTDVVIIDYGMGNLASVRRSVEECGGKAVIADHPKALAGADRIILPGVGAFSDGWAQLDRMGWVPAIRECAGGGTPILGICLGMHLLADRGEEGGGSMGLGLIGGVVTRLVPNRPDFRVPHVGWNSVRITRPHPLLEGIEDGTDYYFVHSYKFVPTDPEATVGVTDHGGTFSAMITKGRVAGVQFHPEKSSYPGFKLLENFLKT